MKKNLQIIKSNGRLQKFSQHKLMRSLRRSGASRSLAKHVIKKIQPQIKVGMTTKQLHGMACRMLKKESRKLATLYNLDRALMDLGPDGFRFEKFMAQVLKARGYKTKTNVVLKGRCIKHEVDIVARRDKKTILIECKFHNNLAQTNDVKVAMYVHARSLDLAANPENKFNEFWLLSNTKFSRDANDYAKCAGLKLYGNNDPETYAISLMIEQTGVYPVSSLSSLKKSQIRALLDHDIVSIQDLKRNQGILNTLGMNDNQKLRVQNELTMLRPRK